MVRLRTLSKYCPVKEMKNMNGLKGLVFLFVLLLASCEVSRLEVRHMLPQSQGRFIFYMHMNTLTPHDIEFTLSGLELEREDGEWIAILNTPLDISSANLTDRQIQIEEVIVDPGLYEKVRFHISEATVKGKNGYTNLALPQPDGEYVVATTLRVRAKESVVVSLVWSPNQSVVTGYLFQPSFHIETQRSSPKGLFLFVSNSGSDYISVIDRGVERVIWAIDVEENPRGMVLNPDSEMLYVVNSGSRTISIVDTALLSLRDTIQLTSGIEPTDIAFLPDINNLLEGKLYITDKRSNEVLVVDTFTRRVEKRLTIGILPSHIATDPVRREVYVTSEGSNTLSIIDASEDVVTSVFTVDSRPTGVVVGEDGVLVFSEGSQVVSVVSPSLRRVVRTIPVGIAPKRGVIGFNKRIFIANSSSNKITLLNAVETVTSMISVGKYPINLVTDGDRNRIYVTNYADGTMTVIDPIREMVAKELFVGKRPYGIVLMN
ncbi:MAG: hypothetical protein ACE5IH_00190 [Thermodesulfobacteriota bacterium]